MTQIRCHDAVFQNIEAVLLDKDGTLAQTAPFLVNLGRQRIDCIDIHIPTIRDELFRMFGLGSHGLASDGLLAVGTRYENEIAAAASIAGTGCGWADALAIAKDAFRDADALLNPKAPQTPLFPGTIEFLDMLCRHGLTVGLLSADSSTNVDDFVQTYKLGKYFQFVKGIDHPPGKPDSSLIQLACQSMNVIDERMLVIGDSSVDIQLAEQGHTAGCIAMAWDSVQSKHLERAGAIAHSFDAIVVCP
ncbi:MAG: HAD-IA family hydrolase [Cyanobacteria bacterium J06633_2]